MKPGLRTLVIRMAALSVALAPTICIADETEQSQIHDEQKARSLASERAQLANQRIQADMEIRAREEQRRLEAAELERLRAREEAIKSEDAIAAGSSFRPTAAASSTDMSRTLQQLKSLGELKDDGYVTEEEFRKIKQKILDSQI